MTRPDAANTTSRPSEASPPMRTDTDWPVASFICEATVRCQTSSYNRNWSPVRPVWPGVRNASPEGRIASCASWAFLTLEA